MINLNECKQTIRTNGAVEKDSNNEKKGRKTKRGKGMDPPLNFSTRIRLWQSILRADGMSCGRLKISSAAAQTINY